MDRDTTIQQTIAENLIWLLEGKDKNEVAKKAGLSVRGINLLKQGETAPQVDTLDRLANAIDVPVWQFVLRRNGAK